MPYRFIPVNTHEQPRPHTPLPLSYNWSVMLAILLYIVIYLTNKWQSFDTSLPVTKAEHLVDAYSSLFSTNSNPSTTTYHIPSRPDIQSFGYDLGGTSCACKMQWSQQQYWQRLIYGPKYMTGHSTTAFLGILFLHRWQWVLLWKLFNEAMEELCLGIFGAFAWYHGIPFDVEPRYDSIILDSMLAPAAFCCIGLHLIYILDVPDPFSEPLHYDWPSFKRVFLPIIWFYAVLQTNGLFGLGMTGKTLNAAVQIASLWLIYYVQSKSDDIILQSSLHKLSIVSACLFVIWLCFVWNVPNQHDEILKSMLAFALSGCFVTIYQFTYTTKRNTVTFVLFGMYITVFVLFLVMDSIIARPTNTYYAHWQWCGINALDGDHTRSCPLIEKQ